MVNGNFYQVKDPETLATRVFESYDKDANKKVSYRESKGILRDIYPKGTRFSDEEYTSFFAILNSN